MTRFDFSTFPIITTARLRLRQIGIEDAPAIMEIFSHPDVLRYLNDPPTDTPEKALAWIHKIDGYYTHKTAVFWAITLHDDERMIGVYETYNWDELNRRVDIGYQLMPAFWGYGYITEATHAVLRWCFDTLDVHRIQGDCTDGNLASEKVMLKCGFTFEGIWRESCWEHGRFVDIKQFGLLKREYEKSGK